MSSSPRSTPVLFLAAVLAFLFSVAGNVFSDQFVLPRLYEVINTQSFNTNNTNTAPAAGQQKPEQQKVVERSPESDVISVARDVSPSVVSIVVSKNLPSYYANPYDFFFGNPFGFDPFSQEPNLRTPVPRAQPPGTPQPQKVGGGTGFIVTSTGLIMTNKHVVDDDEAEYTIITKDGAEYAAEVVTRDTLTDIAFVRMKKKSASPAASDQAPLDNLPVVKFVPDGSQVQVGQSVVAIGNALAEFDNTVTTGVVSGKGRQITAGTSSAGSEDLTNLIQTDASINPGNSGGPLVNLSGEVIGINTAIASNGQGIGFAIPLDQRVIGRLLSQVGKYGKIMRPYLGVRYVMITPELNEQYKLGTDKGAWIRSDQDIPAVMPDTPAAKAGLRGGDIITKINGRALGEKVTLQDTIANSNPGDTVVLTVLRDGREQEMKVTLEERKE